MSDFLKRNVDGFKQGVGDVSRSGIENVQDTYWNVMQGKTAPAAQMTGDLVHEEPPDEFTQSYEAALREHQAMEQQEHLANGYGPYAGRDQQSPDMG